MIETPRSVLKADARVAYAILFGSRGRETAHDRSDTDLALGLTRGASLSAAEVGDLLSRLEAAAGGPVDVVLLDEAGPGLAFRVFRDGRVIFERDRLALVQRKARAILEYLDFRPVEEIFTRAVLGAGVGVDATIVATKVRATRDAVARARQVLPREAAAFEADRTSREVVVLNLFVALQETVALATHWLADTGLDVPGSYREIFLDLAKRGRVPRDLADRLASAAGFRNLIAHQYGVLDPVRVHAMASRDLGDLLDFCEVVSREVAGA